MGTVAIRMDEGKEPRFSNAQDLLDIPSVNLLPQVAVDRLSGLGIEKTALRKGIRGFFYKQDPPELLLKGVSALFNEELWVSREIMTKAILENRDKDIITIKDQTTLTPREIEILSFIATGAKNEHIAEELFISPNTVKTHIYNIFKKINVPNRLQAALWAAKNLSVVEANVIPLLFPKKTNTFL
jgi:DNA-binding CsgD family transcriptional regulator